MRASNGEGGGIRARQFATSFVDDIAGHQRRLRGLTTILLMKSETYFRCVPYPFLLLLLLNRSWLVATIYRLALYD